MMENWVVYNSPKDFPGLFVVRKFLIGPGKVGPTAEHYTSKTLEGVRWHVPDGLYCVPRLEGDEPQIVEVWL